MAPYEFGREQPRPAPRIDPRERDKIWLPPAIRGFVTKAGKLLSAKAQMAWGWLARDVTGFPAEVEFQPAALGGFLQSASTSSPTEIVRTLEYEGLLETLESRPGRKGGVRARLVDPEQVARLRRLRANPQRELPIELPEPAGAVPDQELDDMLAGEMLGIGPPKTEHFPDHAPEMLGIGLTKAEHFESPPDFVAAGCTPLALVDALESHLGAGSAEVWLGRSRWEFTDGVSKLFVGNSFLRRFAAVTKGQAIRAALAACGYPTRLEVDVDASLAAQPPPEMLGIGPPKTEHFGAQQASKTLANRTLSEGSISKPATKAAQPASQPASDFWDEQKAGCAEPDVVGRARALYDAIGDWSMLRGMAIRAVLLVDDGQLSPAELDALVAERPCDFNIALRTLALERQAWPHIGYVKSRLAARHGVTWKRVWDQPRRPRSNAAPAQPR